MELPIGPEHTQDFLIGLFTAHVREVFQRIAAESMLSQPFDTQVKQRLYVQSILETARSFPMSIRGRLEQAAEALATELAAGRTLVP